MKLTLDALTSASRQHLSSSLAGALRPALSALRGRDVAGADLLEDAEAGELILRAVLSRPEGTGSVPLYSLHLVLPSETITLPAEDALSHPLLTGWAASTLAKAFAAPVVAGARALRLASQAPSFGLVQAVETDAGLSGRAILTFAVGDVAVTAIATYGSDDLPEYTRTSSLSGTALARVGREARLTPAAELRDDAEPEWPSPASGALH